METYIVHSLTFTPSIDTRGHSPAWQQL